MKRFGVIGIVLAVLLIAAMCLPVFAADIVPTGVSAGTGGLKTKGGELGIRKVNGDYIFRIVKGTGEALWTGDANAAGGSKNPWDWTCTLGIMDGSDDFTLFDVNITNADHTGSSNTVQVLDIAAITGDAHATETGIKIGAGWDAGIDSASPALLHVLATDTITCAGGTTVLTSAYYGKTIFITGEAAQTITLPANGAAAGSWMRFVVIGSDSTVPTIAAATADTLITPNDAAADSVTFGSGHRIGACVMLISTGTYWVAINEGSTTMTVATN